MGLDYADEVPVVGDHIQMLTQPAWLAYAATEKDSSLASFSLGKSFFMFCYKHLHVVWKYAPKHAFGFILEQMKTHQP